MGKVELFSIRFQKDPAIYFANESKLKRFIQIWKSLIVRDTCE